MKFTIRYLFLHVVEMIALFRLEIDHCSTLIPSEMYHSFICVNLHGLVFVFVVEALDITSTVAWALFKSELYAGLPTA